MSHYITLSKYGNRTHLLKIEKKMRICWFLGVFNKTIIPLALVGYEMITANPYSTRTRGIIVEYTSKHYKDHFRERDRDLTICLALVI